MVEAEKFRRYSELVILHSSLLREYNHEVASYKLNEYIVNLITDMGFIIENRDLKYRKKQNVENSIISRGQTLIKKTPKHMILVNFDYRHRIIKDKKTVSEILEEDPELFERLYPMSFNKWLLKNGMIPPDMAMPEDDETEHRKEFIQTNTDHTKKLSDHKSDNCPFEICVINK